MNFLINKQLQKTCYCVLLFCVSLFIKTVTVSLSFLLTAAVSSRSNDQWSTVTSNEWPVRNFPLS